LQGQLKIILTNKTKDTERREKMPELNEEHFELHDQNKAERYERQKIKFLEDRIKTLENAIESHAKILARFQMTENEAEFEKHEKLWEIKT
jgi:hypothetical protein